MVVASPQPVSARVAMLRFEVSNERERQTLEHSSGPIEFGRGPRRNAIPRCTIWDAYVSKDHVRVEEMPDGRVRVENLSQKQPILLDAQPAVPPGGLRELDLPARLVIGDTTVLAESVLVESVRVDQLQSIAMPHRGRAPEQSLLQLSGAPAPEVLAHWFETVIAVQRMPPATQEFFDRVAHALVDLVGLDRGIVLLRRGDAWQVAGRAIRDETVGGREFSHTILRLVAAEGRTFFQTFGKTSSTESLVGVQAVVASPVFDGQERLVGALYGSRLQRPKSRDLGPLDAQMVQLLASAVGVGLDRSEQEAEATRLLAAKQAAEEADRAKSQFLALVSHELRTPLTTIIGYSEMLRDTAQTDGPADFVDDLGRIHTAGKHLLTLINDILDFSKIEAGKLELAPETFDVEGLVRDVATGVKPLVQNNNNTLEVDCP